MKINVVNHPLIQHKLSIMRQIDTVPKDFRQLLKEIIKIPNLYHLRISSIEVTELTDEVLDVIKNNPKMVTVDALEQQVTPWVQACRPMVLLSKSRGLFFQPVGNMFREIRNLAIDIHNEKSLSEISLRIIQIIKDISYC